MMDAYIKDLEIIFDHWKRAPFWAKNALMSDFMEVSIKLWKLQRNANP